MRIERSLSCFVLIVSFAGCARQGVSAGPRNTQTSTVASPSKKEDTPRTAPADLVRQARNLIASGDLRGAERLLEECVRQTPTDRAALLLLSETARREALELERPASSPFYLRSASALRALHAQYPNLTEEEQRLRPTVYYDEACTLALQGESAAAVKALVEAVDLGFDSVAKVEGDDELDPLRALPEFLTLEARMERANAERLLTQSKPFPFDFTLPRADGSPLALSSLKGKVVFVAFGGTWCSPCRKELPHLIELFRKDHGKGLEIVEVYLENGPPEEVVKLVSAYAKERAIPFPCVIGNEATTLMVPGFEGLPTLVALDADGKVRLKLSGYQPLSALEAIATRLLQERDSRPTSRN